MRAAKTFLNQSLQTPLAPKLEFIQENLKIWLVKCFLEI